MYRNSGSSRQRVLASSLGTSLQKTDRILSGSNKLTLNADIASDQSQTLGDEITIGLDGLNLSAPRDVTVAMGLNYHELAHFLFSPRLLKSDLVVENPENGVQVNIAPPWNYLEESRVETLFAAMYGKSKFYFTVTFSNAAMKSQWSSLGQIGVNGTRGNISDKEKFSALSLHLLAHGRAYLPANVRKAIRDGAFSYFPSSSDQDRIISAEKIIDTYRTLTQEELDEEKSVRANSGGNVRFPRYKVAALRLFNLFPELFNNGNTAGDCNSAADQYSSKPQKRKSREDRKKDAEKEKSASEKAEQDKRDDYEEVELPQDEDDANEGEGDGEETDQEDQGGTAKGSGDEETGDDETDDQRASGGDGDPTEDDEETESGQSSDGSGDESDADSSDEEGNGGSSDESDGGDQDDNSPQEQGVGGKDGEDDQTPLTREEQKELLASVIAQIVDNSSVSDEIDRIVADVEAGGEQSSGAENYIRTTIPESPSDREAIVEVSRVFEGLREQVAPGWNYGSDNGRLNVNRAMMGADPEEMYDEWDEGREDDASVELVILLDMSQSMSGPRINSASMLTHILRRSLTEVDAHVSVYGFSDKDKLIVLKGRDDNEQDSDIPIYRTLRSTEAHAALNRAREVFAQSDCANRVLVVITDGVWENDSSGPSLMNSYGRYTPDQNYRDALSDMGAHKVLCFIDREEAIRGNGNMQFANFVEDLTPLFDTAFDCHDPRDLAAPLTEVVASVVQNSVS